MTKRRAWLVLGVVAIVAVTWIAFERLQSAKHVKELTAQREANTNLRLGSPAILTAGLLSTAPAAGQLIVTVDSVVYGAPPRPTKLFDPDLGVFLDPKHRVWTSPALGDDLVGVWVSVQNQSDSSVDFHASDMNLAEDFGSGVGASWMYSPSMGPFGVQAQTLGLSARERARLELLFSVPTDSLESLAGVYLRTDAASSQPAAAWTWPQRVEAWVHVASFTGTGGPFVPGARPIYDVAGDHRYSVETRSFRLTGRPVRLSWDIRKHGPYTRHGPFIEVWMEHLGNPKPWEKSQWMEEDVSRGMYGDLSTDFYHRSSTVLNTKLGGSYDLSVLAANCRWKLTVDERRWIPVQ